mmetsp:Transcript_1348/g.1531  ORF Transcript_1348/g.1531 Transcript_1348/m.1531 type:complete len:135 (-) Transcript_1348:471-875(-)
MSQGCCSWYGSGNFLVAGEKRNNSLKKEENVYYRITDTKIRRELPVRNPHPYLRQHRQLLPPSHLRNLPPSHQLRFNPTAVPTSVSTAEPTNAPTNGPKAAPTDAPTENPTGSPTGSPTGMPTGMPTFYPTKFP